MLTAIPSKHNYFLQLLVIFAYKLKYLNFSLDKELDVMLFFKTLFLKLYSDLVEADALVYKV